jgi:rubrerythrin
MPTLTPTLAGGATALANDLLLVDPRAQVTPDVLAATMPDSELDTAFVADLLSGMLAHERCGVHLYRSVAARTHNPMLKSQYEAFGHETEHHVDVLERVVGSLGGNPCYSSPAARAVEAMDSKLVESTYLATGALDPMTAESAMLDAVFLAETACHAQWELLSSLTDTMEEGEMRAAFRAAVEEVEAQEDEHLEWARTTKARLVQLRAEGGAADAAGSKAEELVARIKSWFGD